MATYPPRARRPTAAEMEQLSREPNLNSTAGPYVAGWLCIGYRSIPLTQDEWDALFPESTGTIPKRQGET